ncbi:unnamed protein product [Closterium sp. Yama58-4]|nr:unnamed protein product [Closterium sp. Yama58-4]
MPCYNKGKLNALHSCSYHEPSTSDDKREEPATSLPDTSTATLLLLAEVGERADEDAEEAGSSGASPVAPATGIAGGRRGVKQVGVDAEQQAEENMPPKGAAVGKLPTGEQRTMEPTRKLSATEMLVGEPTIGEKSAETPALVQQDAEDCAAGEAEGEQSDAGQSTDSDVVEVKPGPRRTGQIRRAPDFFVPAAFTTAYDIDDDDLAYDDAEEDEDLPELDPDMHADPEHRWDISTMTVKEALASWKGKAELVERPPGVNIMKNRWVLMTKYRIDDTVEREKARLVVKGFTQVYGTDYDETYAPVSSYVTLRIFLSIVAVLDLNLMQLDMKNAFLQSKLDRVLYMSQPDYFNDGTGRVCKLLKSLYGLKQSQLLWYKALNDVLVGAGWKKSHVDEALYFKVGVDKVASWVLVYVDDLLAASSSTAMLRELKELLEAAFELREISPVQKYLGLEIFAATTTRTNITFACSKLGSGLTVRSDQHWREVDCCLAYLANTRDTALEYGGGPRLLELVGYVDADDAGDKQNRTSTGGYVFVYGGAAVSWSSQRIKCATLSSTESEYVAATEAGKEGRRLRFLLAEFQQLDAGKPTVLWVDNKSAIIVAGGMGLTGNLKHMERRQAWLQHIVKREKFALRYIPTTEQPADFLTKALHYPAFNRCSVAIGQVRLAQVGDDDNEVQLTASWASGRRLGRLLGILGAWTPTWASTRRPTWASARRPGRLDADLDARTPTLGCRVWCSWRPTGLDDQAGLPGRPGYPGDVCESRRDGFCEGDLGGGIPRSTWLAGAVAGVESTRHLRCARDEVWSTNQLHAPAKQVHRCPAVEAGIVDTLEAWLEDARRRHAANEYGTLPLAVVEAGIRAVWAMEHPSRPASPRPVNNAGGIDVGVNTGDQVGSSAGGTSRPRGVIHAGEDGSVQARGMQSSAAVGALQGDVGGRRSGLAPMSATHVTAGGIAPSYGYFKFTPDRISVTPLLVGRPDILTWKEAIEPQLEMAGLMGFAAGTVATPSENYPDLRAEFRVVQLLTFTVISRCCSPGVQIALKPCRDYLDAGHQAWHFIESTYQVTDDLYIGQLEEQMTHLRMGDQETATDYCNRARRLLATMRMSGVQYSTASYVTHVLKGLPSSYNLLKRLSVVPSTRATLNEDSLTSYILRDEAMQEVEQSSELLPQVNYAALAKHSGRPGQHGQPGGRGSSGGKPGRDADTTKSAKDGGRGGGGRRRERWICHNPDHLSFECPDRSESDDDDARGGRGRSASRRPRRGSRPRKEKQSNKSTSAKDADSSASGKGRGDGEASCSLVGVVEPTVSLAPEAGEDFQAVAAAVQVNPGIVLLVSSCSHHLMGTKEVFVDL